MADKTCLKCGLTKDITEFNRNKNLKDGRMTQCRACRKEYKKAYYKRTNKHQKERSRNYYHSNPERAKEYQLKSKYGITCDFLKEMLSSQDHKCPLCGKAIEFNTCHVDHSHTTGRIRGAICSQCNLALGLIYDDIQTLKI